MMTRRFDQGLNAGQFDHADMQQASIVLVDETDQSASFVVRGDLAGENVEGGERTDRLSYLMLSDQIDAFFVDGNGFAELFTAG